MSLEDYDGRIYQMIRADINDEWYARIHSMYNTFFLAYIYHPNCRQDFVSILNGGLDSLPVEYQASYLKGCVVCHAKIPKNTLDIIKLHLLSALPIEL